VKKHLENVISTYLNQEIGTKMNQVELTPNDRESWTIKRCLKKKKTLEFSQHLGITALKGKAQKMCW